MASTGTPASTVSMFRTAMNLATVPPPPWSTLPSSEDRQITFLEANIRRTLPMISAEASLEPDLPRLPVNLQMATP